MNEILSQEKSIYIQIKEMIENDILRDILLEEERVPSTNELSRLYAGSLIGEYVDCFSGSDDPVKQKALYYGIEALLEARKEL